MRNHDEQQTFQQIAGVFDEPAFIRRAKRTDNAWTFLLQRAEREYLERLKMPLMRVARLEMLSSGFRAFGDHLEPTSILAISRLFELHSPVLKRRLPPATRSSELAKETASLIDSFDRFNAKWQTFVRELDYDRINALRDGYNNYYVLEKECALQSFRTAADSFRPLPPVSDADVLERFPLLPTLTLSL